MGTYDTQDHDQDWSHTHDMVIYIYCKILLCITLYKNGGFWWTGSLSWYHVYLNTGFPTTDRLNPSVNGSKLYFYGIEDWQIGLNYSHTLIILYYSETDPELWDIKGLQEKNKAALLHIKQTQAGVKYKFLHNGHWLYISL